jgi:DNA-binding transcriptional ArsR family regulator
MTEEPRRVDAANRLSVEAVRAIAHPIRTRLIDELSALGPSTATVLGDRLGESSGSTSYHLRQLAKHGLVEEVEGMGSARERYWRRVPGHIMFGDPDDDSPAAETAGTLAGLAFQDSYNDRIRDALASHAEYPIEWRRASVFSTAWLRLTPEQLEELGQRIEALFAEYPRANADPDPSVPVDPRARRVFSNVNVFPIFTEEQGS